MRKANARSLLPGAAAEDDAVLPNQALQKRLMHPLQQMETTRNQSLKSRRRLRWRLYRNPRLSSGSPRPQLRRNSLHERREREVAADVAPVNEGFPEGIVINQPSPTCCARGRK